MSGTRVVRTLITAGAVGALVWAVVLGGGGAATATQGQAVLAGQYNDETQSATLHDSTDGVGGLFVSATGNTTSWVD